MKKAIIFDLDNTIYSAPSIGDKVFESVLRTIAESKEHTSNMDAIKWDIMRKPFQVVAANHGFSKALTQKGMDLLSNFRYEGPIQYFDDYEETRHLTIDKYLVTTGFIQLQQSKIEGLDISRDFKEIHIVDPATSNSTKKDVFADILQRHNYRINDVLVVGDDLHSEIKAAQDLGIDAIVYDKYDIYSNDIAFSKINDFGQLAEFIQTKGNASSYTHKAN